MAGMKHFGNDQLNHDGYEKVVIALCFFSASIIKRKGARKGVC